MLEKVHGGNVTRVSGSRGSLCVAAAGAAKELFFVLSSSHCTLAPHDILICWDCNLLCSFRLLQETPYHSDLAILQHPIPRDAAGQWKRMPGAPGGGGSLDRVVDINLQVTHLCPRDCLSATDCLLASCLLRLCEFILCCCRGHKCLK